MITKLSTIISVLLLGAILLMPTGLAFASHITGSGTFSGTGSAEIIFGSSSDDTISALAGDDYVFGLDGMDVIKGGDGDDNIFGGDGDDEGDTEARVLVVAGFAVAGVVGDFGGDTLRRFSIWASRASNFSSLSAICALWDSPTPISGNPEGSPLAFTYR